MEENIEDKKKNNINNLSIIISYLKKIVTWQSMSLLAAVIMPLLVYHFQKEDSLESKSNENIVLTDSIYYNVKVIEETFKPSELVLDTSYDNEKIKYMKLFQQYALNLAAYWNVLSNSTPIMDYSDKKISDVEDLINERINNIMILRGNFLDVINIISVLNNYSEIDSVNNLKLSKEDIIQLKEKDEEFIKLFDNTIHKSCSIYKNNKNKFIKESKANSNPQYMESMRLIDEFSSDAKFLELCNYIFKLIVIQNKKYMSYYGYLNIKKEEKSVMEKQKEELDELKKLPTWN